MEQRKKFMNPVYKEDDTNTPIAVADTVKFILKDGGRQIETLTYVSDDGRTLGWDHSVNSTRKEDVRAVEGTHHFSCVYYGGSGTPTDGIHDPI